MSRVVNLAQAKADREDLESAHRHIETARVLLDDVEQRIGGVTPRQAAFLAHGIMDCIVCAIGVMGAAPSSTSPKK